MPFVRDGLLNYLIDFNQFFLMHLIFVCERLLGDRSSPSQLLVISSGNEYNFQKIYRRHLNEKLRSHLTCLLRCMTSVKNVN